MTLEETLIQLRITQETNTVLASTLEAINNGTINNETVDFPLTLPLLRVEDLIMKEAIRRVGPQAIRQMRKDWADLYERYNLDTEPNQDLREIKMLGVPADQLPPRHWHYLAQALRNA